MSAVAFILNHPMSPSFSLNVCSPSGSFIASTTCPLFISSSFFIVPFFIVAVARIEFDVWSYFAFITGYASSSISPPASAPR